MALDIIYPKDYDLEYNGFYRYVLVVLDKFSKFGWTIGLKNKNSQSIKDAFEKILKSSKKKIKDIQQTLLWELLLQKILIVLLEIFLKDQFLKKEMIFGLVYCLY